MISTLLTLVSFISRSALFLLKAIAFCLIPGWKLAASQRILFSSLVATISLVTFYVLCSSNLIYNPGVLILFCAWPFISNGGIAATWLRITNTATNQQPSYTLRIQQFLIPAFYLLAITAIVTSEFKLVHIPSQSMSPSLIPGDVVLIDKNPSPPSTGQIWLFHYKGQLGIKRLEKLNNKGAFLVGDNRGESVDSRHFGYIAKDNLLGEAKLILFNPTHFDRTLSVLKAVTD